MPEPQETDETEVADGGEGPRTQEWIPEGLRDRTEDEGKAAEWPPSVHAASGGKSKRGRQLSQPNEEGPTQPGESESGNATERTSTGPPPEPPGWRAEIRGAVDRAAAEALEETAAIVSAEARQRFELETRELREELASKVKEVVEQASKDEGERSTALEERLSSQQRRLEEAIEGQRTSLDERLDAYRQELHRAIEDQRTSLDQHLDAQREKLDNAIEGQRQQLVGWFERSEQALAGVAERADGKVDELRGRIDSVDERVDSSISGLEQAISGSSDENKREIAELAQRLEGLIAESAEQLRAEDLSTAESISAELDGIKREVVDQGKLTDQRTEKLEATQADTAEGLAATIETLRNSSSEQEKRTREEVAAVRESANELLEGHASAIDTLDTRVSSNTASIESLTKWASDLAEKLESTSTEVRAAIGGEGERIRELGAALADLRSTIIGELRSSMAVQRDQLAELAPAVSGQDRDLEGIRQALSHRDEQFESEASKREQVEHRLTGTLEEMVERLARQTERLGEIDDRTLTGEAELKQRLERQGEDVAERFSRLTAQLENLRFSVEEIATRASGAPAGELSEPVADQDGPAEAPRPSAERASTEEGSGDLTLTDASFEDLRRFGLSVTQSARLIAFRDGNHGRIETEDLARVSGLPEELRQRLMELI